MLEMFQAVKECAQQVQHNENQVDQPKSRPTPLKSDDNRRPSGEALKGERRSALSIARTRIKTDQNTPNKETDNLHHAIRYPNTHTQS